MRKLTLALMAFACLVGPAVAQQVPSFNIYGPLPPGSNTIGTVNLGTLNGAATAASQATGNGSLASIDGKMSALGTQTKSASRSTTPASDLANVEPAGAPITGAAMPAGGIGLTGWLSAIWNQLVAANTRNAIYVDAIKQSFAASSTNYFPVHNGGAGVTRGSYTAGCSVTATLYVRGSNDGFTSSIYVGSMTIPAGSDSPSAPAVGSILQFPSGFAAYQGVIVLGGTAGTCTSAMSLTNN